MVIKFFKFFFYRRLWIHIITEKKTKNPIHINILQINRRVCYTFYLWYRFSFIIYTHPSTRRWCVNSFINNDDDANPFFSIFFCRMFVCSLDWWRERKICCICVVCCIYLLTFFYICNIHEDLDFLQTFSSDHSRRRCHVMIIDHHVCYFF